MINVGGKNVSKHIEIIEKNEISVLSYGAKGDGVADDTDSFNQAITVVNSRGGGTITVPPGTYMIDAVNKSINMKSNVRLLLDIGTVIKAIPNSSTSYKIIKCLAIQNFTITGGTIQGERVDHIGSTGEFGMGINIDTCSNFLISDLTIRDCWGDGIYLGAGETSWNEKGRIVNVICDNNRRQGISVISAVDLIIDSCRLINTNGTSPEGGIDFEPNYATQKMEGIRMVNPITSNNAGRAIAIGCRLQPHVDIVVDNHFDDAITSNGAQITVSYASVAQTGKIVFMNPVWKNSLFNAFTSRNYYSKGARIEIHSPTIINANRDGSLPPTTVKYHSAIGIYAEDTDSGDYPIGNVHVYRPSIVTTDPAKLADRTLYVVNDKTASTSTVKIENISFIDPVNLSGCSIPNAIFVTSANNPDKIYLRDINGLLVDSLNADATLSGSTVKPFVYLPDTATADRTKTVTTFFPLGIEITFENRHSVRKLIVTAGATGRIYPDMTAAGQTLQLSGIGSRVTIKRVGTDQWVVVNKVGTVNVI